MCVNKVVFLLLNTFSSLDTTVCKEKYMPGATTLMKMNK